MSFAGYYLVDLLPNMESEFSSNFSARPGRNFLRKYASVSQLRSIIREVAALETSSFLLLTILSYAGKGFLKWLHERLTSELYRPYTVVSRSSSFEMKHNPVRNLMAHSTSKALALLWFTFFFFFLQFSFSWLQK